MKVEPNDASRIAAVVRKARGWPSQRRYPGSVSAGGPGTRSSRVLVLIGSGILDDAPVRAPARHQHSSSPSSSREGIAIVKILSSNPKLPR